MFYLGYALFVYELHCFHRLHKMPIKPVAISISMLLLLGGFGLAGADTLAPPANFINTWLVLGCFDNDPKNAGYKRDWTAETKVEPRQGLISAGKTWRYFDDRLFSRNYDDYQDLFGYFKIKRGESVAAKVAYAHVYVYSDVPQEGQSASARITSSRPG